MENIRFFNELPIRVIETEEGSVYYASDIGKLLGTKQTGRIIDNFSPKEIVQAADRARLGIKTYKIYKNRPPREYPGLPLITELGLKRLVCISRSTKANEVAEFFGIDTNTRYEPIETETIRKILIVFKNEEHIPQFPVLQTKYRIDLYFPKYKLAIECDENEHKYHVAADRERENAIKDILGCRFIRYKPQQKGFDILGVIGQIYDHITRFQGGILTA